MADIELTPAAGAVQPIPAVPSDGVPVTFDGDPAEITCPFPEAWNSSGDGDADETADFTVTITSEDLRKFGSALTEGDQA